MGGRICWEILSDFFETHLYPFHELQDNICYVTVLLWSPRHHSYLCYKLPQLNPYCHLCVIHRDQVLDIILTKLNILEHSTTTVLLIITVLIFQNLNFGRIENLNLHTRAGKIKTLGATLSVAGALTTSLYKGKALHLVHHSFNNTVTAKEVHENYVIGTLMLVGSCISYAIWFIVQVYKHPIDYSLILYSKLMK